MIIVGTFWVEFIRIAAARYNIQYTVEYGDKEPFIPISPPNPNSI